MLSRKVIFFNEDIPEGDSKIAKDVVRSLLANQAIEVEDGRRDEAELDLAGVLVEYLNEVDRVSQDAHEALQRHNLPAETLGRVKKAWPTPAAWRSARMRLITSLTA